MPGHGHSSTIGLYIAGTCFTSPHCLCNPKNRGVSEGNWRTEQEWQIVLPQTNILNEQTTYIGCLCFWWAEGFFRTSWQPAAIKPGHGTSHPFLRQKSSSGCEMVDFPGTIQGFHRFFGPENRSGWFIMISWNIPISNGWFGGSPISGNLYLMVR